MKKKILVTGGAGYIGSQTAYYLIGQGYDVVIIDNLSIGRTELIPSVARFYQVELTDKSSVQKVLTDEAIDCVIHFAANSQVGEGEADPSKYYNNNIVGTLSLLDAMKDRGVKNIVFSSTAAVFGIPENIPIDEACSTNPINTYGRSKLMLEQILYDYHRSYDFSVTIFRYFNACGADLENRTGETHDPETHLIPILLQVAGGQRDQFSIYGDDYETEDGTCIRDYIHTVDLASAHKLAADKIINSNQKLFKKYNLGTKTGYSVREIYELAQKITGKKINMKTSPRRIGDPPKLIADSQLAQIELGWSPKNSDLKTIISTAWAWHQKWYNDR